MYMNAFVIVHMCESRNIFEQNIVWSHEIYIPHAKDEKVLIM